MSEENKAMWFYGEINSFFYGDKYCAKKSNGDQAMAKLDLEPGAEENRRDDKTNTI